MKNIRKLVQESKNLSELEEALDDNGFNFNSGKKLYNFIKREYIKESKELVNEIYNKPVEKLEELPYSEIIIDGTTYRIHGIEHGDKYLLKLNKEVKRFIQNEVSSYKTPESDYLLEIGFSDILGLEKNKEMEDALKDTIDSLSENPLKLFSSILNYWIKRPYAVLIGRSKLAKTAHNAVNNINYLPKFKEICNVAIIPTPLNLELKNKYGDALEKFSAGFSENMARHILAHSKNGYKIIHAVVGLGHEAEIVHYLQKISQERKISKLVLEKLFA